MGSGVSVRDELLTRADPVRTINIAEAAGLAFLCVVKTSGPVYSDVALVPAQSCSTL